MNVDISVTILWWSKSPTST